MVRGHAKAEAQRKNLAKNANQKTAHSAAEAAAIKNNGQTAQCPSCMQTMPNIGALKNHFENKHPKLPLPAICQG
jgi:hypothetical protein